jgi:hypothetical protein
VVEKPDGGVSGGVVYHLGGLDNEVWCGDGTENIGHNLHTSPTSQYNRGVEHPPVTIHTDRAVQTTARIRDRQPFFYCHPFLMSAQMTRVGAYQTAMVGCRVPRETSVALR